MLLPLRLLKRQQDLCGWCNNAPGRTEGRNGPDLKAQRAPRIADDAAVPLQGCRGKQWRKQVSTAAMLVSQGNLAPAHGLPSFWSSASGRPQQWSCVAVCAADTQPCTHHMHWTVAVGKVGLEQPSKELGLSQGARGRCARHYLARHAHNFAIVRMALGLRSHTHCGAQLRPRILPCAGRHLQPAVRCAPI